MNSTDQLKEIERRAYRSTFEDGIYDVALGILLVLFGILPIAEMTGLSRFYFYPLLIVLPLAALLAKRCITVPRLGAVEFGPKRKARARVMAWIFGAAIVLMAPVLILVLTGRNDGAAGEQTALWIIITAAALPILTMAAFLMDYPRMYVYLGVVCAGIVEFEFLSPVIGKVPGAVVSLGLPGIIILVFGIVLFSRFLRKYPAQGREAHDVG